MIWGSYSENVICFTGSSEATAGCEEEEAGNTGEAHRDAEGEMLPVSMCTR